MVKNIHTFSFLSDFNETRNFVEIFSKTTQISNFMKIRSVGAKLLHTNRRTDRRQTGMTKPIVSFRNFAKSPENAFMPCSILNVTNDSNDLNLVVTARTTRPDVQNLRMLSTYCSYVPYGYHNNRWFFLHAALTGWSS